MIDRLHHRGWHYVLLIGISAILFFLNLGGATLWDIDEGRNSECAFEMMESGNWIVPTFNSQLRAHKPALLYWLQILSYSLFGVNEFAARLPSALAALGTVLLAYELARSMFTRTTGLLAGVIAATTPMLCGAARFANPDALLNFCTVLTLTIFWLGLAERRWWWFALLGGASGLAVLAKGPVGLLLPGAIVTAFLLWERRWGVAWDRRWLLAFWSFVIVALPWYAWVGIETKGEFLKAFLWTHNIERGTDTMENHHGFPGYYLVVLLVGTAPWSIFAAIACWFGMWSAVRVPWTSCQSWWAGAAEGVSPLSPVLGGEGRRRLDRPAAYRLLICWIGVFVVFFSIAATKLPNYVLPALAPCVLLLARFLQRWQSGTIHVPNWLIYLSVVNLLLIGVLFSAGLSIAGGVGELALLRGRFFPGLAGWAFIGLVPMFAAALCWWFARRRQHGRFVTTLAVCAVLLLGPMAAYASVVFNRCKAPSSLVEQADALRRDEDIRIAGWNVEHLPSLNFYVKRNVEHLRDDKAAVNFLSTRLPVYLFLPLDDWRRIEAQVAGRARLVGRQVDMYHHAEIVVVTNR
ncbi:MAG: glycosyltransferase family 39 protein [Planctomycetes bacterium]|nr:glycosyltransferase family 39 protein [Planctomycetota bacterium]